jgi:hypothetical protein
LAWNCSLRAIFWERTPIGLPPAAARMGPNLRSAPPNQIHGSAPGVGPLPPCKKSWILSWAQKYLSKWWSSKAISNVNCNGLGIGGKMPILILVMILFFPGADSNFWGRFRTKLSHITVEIVFFNPLHSRKMMMMMINELNVPLNYCGNDVISIHPCAMKSTNMAAFDEGVLSFCNVLCKTMTKLLN